MSSPTERSLKALRERGYSAQVVERWNPFAKIRQDLFKWIDLVAVRVDEVGILGVQTTTAANGAARLAKARGNGALLAWLMAGGRLSLWTWSKRKGHWVLKERPISISDLVMQDPEPTPASTAGSIRNN